MPTAIVAHSGANIFRNRVLGRAAVLLRFSIAGLDACRELR